jgi:molybdopterin converting factor small subunit
MLSVLIFGAAATAAKADRVSVEIGQTGAATVRDVLDALGVQHPEIGFALPGARLALNHAFAAPDARVGADDELALISLVGGG